MSVAAVVDVAAIVASVVEDPDVVAVVVSTTSKSR